jgi:gluconolactonase
MATGGSAGSGGGGSETCAGGPFDGSPLPGGASANEICSGMTFTEGPVWVGGMLYFSDFDVGDSNGNFDGDIVSYVPGGNCEVWRPNSGTNGLAIGPDGNILGARHTDQTLTTFDLGTMATTTLVADYTGQNFSSPNDLAVRGDGNIYFSDPAWQVGDRPENHPQSLYRRAPSGELSVVEELDDRRPNGVTLSPDESTLYVSVIQPDQILMYDLDPAGAPSGSTQFVSSGSDGMAIDCAGNLYLTSGGVQVYSPGGQMLGSIGGVNGTTNAAFGGPDNRTLYITAGSSLYEVELNIPGLPY